jgi:hypothetical protein
MLILFNEIQSSNSKTRIGVYIETGMLRLVERKENSYNRKEAIMSGDTTQHQNRHLERRGSNGKSLL